MAGHSAHSEINNLQQQQFIQIYNIQYIQNSLLMNFEAAGYARGHQARIPNYQQQQQQFNKSHQQQQLYGGSNEDDFEDEEDIDFNAIAVGQRKPQNNLKGGRVQANRSQMNQNFVGNQQTSVYDHSQMSTQSHSNAPRYQVQSKNSFQKRLSPTQMNTMPPFQPPQNTGGFSSPMTFGNSPSNGSNQFKNGQGQNQNQVQQQKFKRPPVYAHVNTDMDGSHQQLHRIQEEPESMLQTPFSQENQNMGPPSPAKNIDIQNDFIDTTPRIASIEEINTHSQRKTPQAFAQLPELDDQHEQPITDDFRTTTAQLLLPPPAGQEESAGNNSMRARAAQFSNKIAKEQHNAYNNSFTKGVQNVQLHNNASYSVRPNFDEQDTAERDSTAIQRNESLQASRNHGTNSGLPRTPASGGATSNNMGGPPRSPNHGGPMQPRSPMNNHHQLPTIDEDFGAGDNNLYPQPPMMAPQHVVKSKHHQVVTATTKTTKTTQQQVMTTTTTTTRQQHQHFQSQQQLQLPDMNNNYEFQTSIQHRNAGQKPFTKNMPLNQQAFQKAPGGDDDEENSFLFDGLDMMPNEPDNNVVIEGTQQVPRRQQYLSQQEKVSDHMFNQSSIADQKYQDITDENMNNYFPPAAPVHQRFEKGPGRPDWQGPGQIRPKMVAEPNKRQGRAQIQVPKPNQKKQTSLPQKDKGISHNKMYQHLYKNLVPNTMKQAHRVSNPQHAGPLAVPKQSQPVSTTIHSPYKNYVAKVNQYLDKNDANHQMDLKYKNLDFLERNSAMQSAYKESLLEKQQHRAIEDMYAEMEDCSFKPKINKKSNLMIKQKRNPNFQTSEVDIPDEFHRSRSKNNLQTAPEPRSADDFYRAEMKFIERHERWRDEKIRNDTKMLNRGAKSKKISRNSERIWDKSQKRQSQATGASAVSGRFGLGQSISQGRLGSCVSIGTSPDSKGFQGPFSDNQADRNRVGSITSNQSVKSTKSIKNFLNRNYHTIQDQKKIVMRKASERAHIESLKERAIESDRYRTLKCTSPTIKSIDSRGSSKGSDTRPKFADRNFRPTLSERSKQLSSNRSKDRNVFKALHGEKKAFQDSRKKLEHDDIMKYKNMARQKILRNVNETSASKLAEQFENEFNSVYMNQLKQGKSIYLLDILEDLKFLDNQEISKSFGKIEQILQNGKLSLIIDLEENKQQNFSIKSNLLEVCLAIQNLSNNFKPHPQLEDSVLRQFMNRIKRQTLHVQPEQLLISQIVTLKDIVVRSAFNLSSQQISQISQFFGEFNRTRRNLTFEEKKLGRYQKVVEVEMAKYQDIPNIHYNPLKTEPNSSHLKSVKSHIQLTMDNSRGRNQAQGRNSRTLSKASSSNSSTRYNSHKLFLHAERQKEYKQELKEWYDKKNRLQEEEDLVFRPQLGANTLRLAQKRNTNVIEHAREYVKIQRVDLDTNTVEYNKNKKECTFRPNTKGSGNQNNNRMGRKNLNDIIYSQDDLKGRKNSSGVTASTNFGSGVSGTENENSAGGWPSQKKKEPVELDPRISPELKVQAAKSNNSKQKSNPMTKYISAQNFDDEEDNMEPSRTLKSNSVQEFLDIEPVHKNKKGNQPLKKVQSLEDVLEKNGGGPKQLFTPKTLLSDDPNKPSSQPSSLLKPPAKTVLSARAQNLARARPFSYQSMLPTVEEPICVLKIELDGRNIEEIKVFENDNPETIVQEFGDNFNLSQNAMRRLLDQIHEQIQMDENSFT